MDIEKVQTQEKGRPSRVDDPALEGVQDNEVINISGHKQELDRIFDPLSIIGTAITTGNVWVALAGTITVAVYDGGPPGIIYEFIVVSVFYWFIAASIAELASAIPSSGGVYHWATITGGKYGRICGYFAGWWNFLAWIFAVAATNQITGALFVSLYAVEHPGFEAHRWQVFVTYLITTWLLAGITLFANHALPRIEQVGGFLILAGFLITVIVCAVMPHVNGQPYAPSSFVWTDWQNQTGYSSDGFAFMLGMLNGAFAVGTPDITSHLAEEIPNPRVNIPKAMLAQYAIGFLTALFYLIAILYAINDLNTILKSSFLFPLTTIYLQATGSAAGSVGLLLLVLLPTLIATIGCYLTASRIFWTLARDKATPFHNSFKTIHPRWKNPFNAIILCAAIVTILGCIYVGSSTAFNAFVGSFVILTMASYLAAILPHLLSGRSNITPGYFWMKGLIGYIVNIISCLFMMAFIVIFCFPFALPVNAENMNYACLITGGLSIFFAAFWLYLKKDYIGPRVIKLEGLATEIRVAEYRAGVSK
jgi:amino acid transporter